jgi:copper transport protein
MVLQLNRGSALPIVQRFSMVAVPIVAALALTGIVLAIVQVESLSALTGTAYGNVLLAKLVAVGALLCLAALNRFRLTPGLSTPNVGVRALAQSIGGEIALAAVVFALVASWRFTPPPRTLATMPSIPSPPPTSSPAIALLHGDRAMAQVTLSPAQVGHVLATIAVMGADHGPLEAKEVTLSLAQPSRGVESIERQAVKTHSGVWQIERLFVPLPGQWQMRVDMLINDFEKVILEGGIGISGPAVNAPSDHGGYHAGHGLPAPAQRGNPATRTFQDVK